MLWTLVGVVGVLAGAVVFLKDHRMLARYGYVCGLAGLVLLVIPALLPGVDVRAERREDLDSLARLLDSARRVLQDPAADLLRPVLVAKRGLFTSAGKHVLGMDLPAAARPRLRCWRPGSSRSA